MKKIYSFVVLLILLITSSAAEENIYYPGDTITVRLSICSYMGEYAYITPSYDKKIFSIESFAAVDEPDATGAFVKSRSSIDSLYFERFIVPIYNSAGTQIGLDYKTLGTCSVYIMLRIKDNVPSGRYTFSGVAANCRDNMGNPVNCTVSSVNIVIGCRHELVIDEAVVPTCTGSGLTQGSHCIVCNEVIEPQQIIPRLQHNVVFDIEPVPAANGTDGHSGSAFCSLCNSCLPDNEKISYNKSVYLPNSITRIENYAFSGISAQQVVIPYGTTYIGDNAFEKCMNLRILVIPSTVVEIGDNILNSSRNTVIICKRHSTAEQYAISNGLFCYVGDE